MKRPEGFDGRPEEPDAPADDARAPRQRRGRLTSWRAGHGADRHGPAAHGSAGHGSADDGREARPASVSSSPADGSVAPTAAPGPETRSAVRTPGAAPTQASSQRERASTLAGAAGRRLGAGWSSVAERLREYTPDEDHAGSGGSARPSGAGATAADPTTGGASAGDATGADDTSGVATVTDVIDAHRASRPSAEDAHSTPIGAGVRAAETAREARVAKRRRRLLERAEVRRFTRRARHRRAAWITAGAVVVVFGASILVAVYSPLMALRTIEVRGTERVDATALRQALSDQVGTPLARIDFGEVKRDIAGFPLIESYVTEEVPPHTLVVTVTERTPVVAVQSGDSYDLVDPAGIVVQSSPDRPEGVPVADVQRAELGSPVFRTMTEVVLSLPSTVRRQVTDVRATTADDVTLTLDDGSSVVWGSPDDSDAKASLLAALVADHASRDPGTKVEFDVSAPDNGIVRPAQ
ncbi:FtsQ-type POTRA domain-containing protein [Curtobacterium sp. RHCJP20]|uniref:FtsQ-type POTRA domain-containing protein n=1 Tax=Curtobacterium subtropicum TaxID=3055138 RepID=A0ABT7TFS9_9MICO|nr:FtsQ-type POTRA domain-containing protein [Curtobacterium subtropicum]MDM7888417.1 FtsQ-type POTRA domain-containing protein [Curtobacterium subtropicum]